MSSCAKCERAGIESPRCCYCDALLSSRHEHEHVPIPKRHGGKEIFPVCVNCHDLKDRMALKSWDAEMFFSAFGGLNAEGRILMARVIALELDLKAKLAPQEET